MKHPVLRAREIAGRSRAIRNRLFMTLEDGPDDAVRRACAACGAGVISYVCRPEKPNGRWQEILRCERGFDLPGDDDFVVVPNVMWEGANG